MLETRRSNGNGGGRTVKPQWRRSKTDGGGQDITAAVWAAVSGLTIGEAWLRRDEPKPAEQVARFQDAMKQLAAGVPFAYAVGSVGFRTLDLKIDARALIPRAETEGLVELVLKHAQRDTRTGRRGLAADIGTGSGCIALSLAVEGDFDRVVAVEQAPEAAALARENLERVAPATPVEIRPGNLLEPLVDKGERFRVIVSNPPYLTAAEYAALDASVARYEPGAALVSGEDGLKATREILAGAQKLLDPTGCLAIEIDERRADAVRALAREYGWRRVEIHADLFSCPRYALFTP